MSTKPDSGFDLGDLELEFLPAWAKQAPETNRYADFKEQEDRGPGRGRRPGRGSPPRPRSDSPGGGGRPDRGGGGGRPDPSGRGDRRSGGGFSGNRGPRAPYRNRERPEPEVLPELNVTLVPDEKGTELLVRQIRLTGRAYPVFDIAQLILRKPDRYRVTYSVVRKPDGTIAQELWNCNLDNTAWLSEQDAVRHVLKKHFDTFYQAEKTPTDPPKGTYTFVAQCGMSGTIFGPPNYHDYHQKVRRLHAARYSHVAFDRYQARIRIVRDEEVVKRWVEDQSFTTKYICLNVPEQMELDSEQAVEKHFREVHLANIIRRIDTWMLPANEALNTPVQELRRLAYRAREEQMRFPLKVAGVLSQQFAAHGLQFFKVNKTITHVAVSRPHYLDLEATPLSDSIRRIVDFIDQTPRCTRRRLIDALEPSPAVSAVEVPPAVGSPADASPGPTPAAPVAAEPGAAVAPSADAAPASEPQPVPPSAPEPEKAVATTDGLAPTPEQKALIADLHWLIHQGHVIEFANGKLETAKKPVPKPQPKPKPAKQVAKKPVVTAPPASEPGDTAKREPKVEASVSGTPEALPEDAAATPETLVSDVVDRQSAPTAAEETQAAQAEAVEPVEPTPNQQVAESSVPAGGVSEEVPKAAQEAEPSHAPDSPDSLANAPEPTEEIAADTRSPQDDLSKETAEQDGAEAEMPPSVDRLADPEAAGDSEQPKVN